MLRRCIPMNVLTYAIGKSLATLAGIVLAEHNLAKVEHDQHRHATRINVLADELAGDNPSPARRSVPNSQPTLTPKHGC